MKTYLLIFLYLTANQVKADRCQRFVALAMYAKFKDSMSVHANAYFHEQIEKGRTLEQHEAFKLALCKKHVHEFNANYQISLKQYHSCNLKEISESFTEQAENKIINDYLTVHNYLDSQGPRFVDHHCDKKESLTLIKNAVDKLDQNIQIESSYSYKNFCASMIKTLSKLKKESSDCE